MHILKLKKIHPQIARVWRDGLKDNLYSVLGLNFKRIFEINLDIKENKLFVAFNKKKKVVGFVIFGNEKILIQNT